MEELILVLSRDKWEAIYDLVSIQVALPQGADPETINKLEDAKNELMKLLGKEHHWTDKMPT